MLQVRQWSKWIPKYLKQSDCFIGFPSTTICNVELSPNANPNLTLTLTAQTGLASSLLTRFSVFRAGVDLRVIGVKYYFAFRAGVGDAVYVGVE